MSLRNLVVLRNREYRAAYNSLVLVMQMDDRTLFPGAKKAFLDAVERLDETSKAYAASLKPDSPKVRSIRSER